MLWIAGLAIGFIGGVWLVVNGFRTSLWWGLGNLLVPFVALIFGLVNFADNKVPMLLYVAGIAMTVAGGGWSGGGAAAV